MVTKGDVSTTVSCGGECMDHHFTMGVPENHPCLAHGIFYTNGGEQNVEDEHIVEDDLKLHSIGQVLESTVNCEDEEHASKDTINSSTIGQPLESTTKDCMANPLMTGG
ncbi:hypothetical protein L2E82_30497 [Cichorium intybus]|uniref:Uncharacterized protein n=1 Tax=Cichorium intybus TaxID=13427 RepID=A0ACB9D0G6_CICIN|nr:hypothetical protein L2E82_30497 [Cichorium intybus]